MTTPVGPFTLVGIGTPLNVPVPPGVFTTVVVDNASPYTCAVNIGSPQHWLEAFTSDSYDIPAGASVTITPSAVLTGASTDANLTATFYRADETPGGTYPVSLTSQAVVAALTGTVVASILGTVPVLNQQQLIASGAYAQAQVIPLTIPAWCRKIVVMATGVNPFASVIVKGATSGFDAIDWSPVANPLVSSLILAGSVYGAIDPTATLAFSNFSGGGGHFWAVAIEEDDVYGGPANLQNVQSTAYQYCDGVVDEFATITVAALGHNLLVPAPPAGYLNKITTLTMVNTSATATRPVFIDDTSGVSFGWQVVAAGAGAAGPGPVVVAGTLSVALSTAVTSVVFAASYKPVPLLR